MSIALPCFLFCGGGTESHALLMEVVDRGADAAAGLDRHAHVAQRQLDAAERAQDHQLVEIAEMTDAEHLAVEARQTHAEREAIAAIGMADEVVGIEALGELDRADRVRLPALLLGAEL